MHRKNILDKLTNYSPEYAAEKEFRASFISFIKGNIDCFERSLQIGHITGSAWIVNKDRDKALLTHHAKLNRWLQPGGHADGDSRIDQVSMKEAREETGLSSLRLLSDNIFDIDIHSIPARNHEPEHLHYDIRFIFEADEHESLTVTSESKDLQWVSLSSLLEKTEKNQSILRMAEKVATYCQETAGQKQ